MECVDAIDRADLGFVEAIVAIAPPTHHSFAATAAVSESSLSEYARSLARRREGLDKRVSLLKVSLCPVVRLSGAQKTIGAGRDSSDMRDELASTEAELFEVEVVAGVQTTFFILLQNLIFHNGLTMSTTSASSKPTALADKLYESVDQSRGHSVVSSSDSEMSDVVAFMEEELESLDQLALSESFAESEVSSVK